MREEPVLLFAHMIGQDRSVLDLLNADYGFVTERLVKFYELRGEVARMCAATVSSTWCGPMARRGRRAGSGLRCWR